MFLPHGTMVDWSVSMVFPGHTHLLFRPEWESDLRSSTPQSRTLTTRQRRFSYLVMFCVCSSRYLGGLVSDLRSSATQSRTLSTRQRRFSYLVVFCVCSSWCPGGLVCGYGISWLYSLAVLVRVGIRPAIFHTSVKDSSH